MCNIVEHFRINGHHRALQALYRQIPGGCCAQCPACCYDDVPLSIVEFIDIVVALGDRIEVSIARAEDWYIEQYSRVQPCIFLNEHRCSIYAVRPLTCRLFGHQSRVDQEKRMVKVRRDKANAARWLHDTYGISVAQTVIDHAIAPCDFKPTQLISSQTAAEVFDAINQLSATYYRTGLIVDEAINLSLIEWMVYYYCDEDVLFERIKRG